MAKMVISISQLHKNIQKILSFKKGSYMFVLKANAYGHGSKQIAHELNHYAEISMIGVATPEEAMEMVDYTNKKIVILGFTPNSQLKQVTDLGIIPTVFSLVQAELTQKDAEIFINVDTGFHRLGKAPTEDYKKEIHKIMSLNPRKVIGIFTHLKLQTMESDLKQIKQFEDFVKGFNIPYISISDSIAFMKYRTEENLFRIGALMFGLTSKTVKNTLNLKPIQSLICHISRIEEIKQTDTAFYRSSIRKGMKIATIQIGYADGLFRTMPLESYVTVHNHRCPYIEVGMDQSIIDITGVDANVDDEAIIFGPDALSLQNLAILCDTNKNNLLTMISNRVQRVYIDNTEETEQI